MKICPYCAEKIQDEAIKCRYCAEWLDKEKAEHLARQRSELPQRPLQPIDQVDDWESYARLFRQLHPHEQASRWERLSIPQRQLLQNEHGINGRSETETGARPGRQMMPKQWVPSLGFIFIMAVFGLLFALGSISALANTEYAISTLALGFAVLLVIPATHRWSGKKGSITATFFGLAMMLFGAAAFVPSIHSLPGAIDAAALNREWSTPNATEWTTLRAWSGDGIKSTEIFEVKSPEWRIDWTTSGEAFEGAGIFQVFVHTEDGTFITTVADQQGVGEDLSYIQSSPGKYYLAINSANVQWKVIVQDKL